MDDAGVGRSCAACPVPAFDGTSSLDYVSLGQPQGCLDLQRCLLAASSGVCVERSLLECARLVSVALGDLPLGRLATQLDDPNEFVIPVKR